MSDGLFGPKPGLFGPKKTIWKLAALAGKLKPKHKVFVSFYHHDDQIYRDIFEKYFSETFISKSVPTGGIDSANSADYISKLIRQEYLGDASVVIVLVGPRTYCRKHVDWEIAAGLDSRVRGTSGLVGLVLPNNITTVANGWRATTCPARLNDNFESGFAKLYKWDEATSSPAIMENIIQEAFDNRISKKEFVKNGRIQMTNNI